ncbi:MAG: hypothetical protein ATN34_03035 [Epulopiscium sp. Nele67-Bin002]|nr:MAG: hypothetical protein BEN18_11215 [Epulopiscium sp. Nuni2H_MBin001]OON92154.1 MAG: hypothetical protein ATN34_03035 [Epulopiscium sp. Nele67-Bin002]
MVYLFLNENCELVEAMTPIDLLRRAKIDVTVLSLTGSKLVKTSSNIAVEADDIFENSNFKNATAFILPGGPGTNSYSINPNLKNLILDSYAKGILIAAICAAPTYLESIGIKVNGTVYPTYKEQISDYKNVKVYKSSNLITGEALGASIDFSLEIIKYLKDEHTATEVSNSIYK